MTLRHSSPPDGGSLDPITAKTPAGISPLPKAERWSLQ